MSPVPTSREEAADRLREQHGLKLTASELEHVIRINDMALWRRAALDNKPSFAQTATRSEGWQSG